MESTAKNEQTVYVCQGPTCSIVGGAEIETNLKSAFSNLPVTVLGCGCMGQCHQAAVVAIDEEIMGYLTPENALEAVLPLINSAPKKPVDHLDEILDDQYFIAKNS